VRVRRRGREGVIMGDARRGVSSAISYCWLCSFRSMRRDTVGRRMSFKRVSSHELAMHRDAKQARAWARARHVFAHKLTA
jgi:hypothetical protein